MQKSILLIFLSAAVSLVSYGWGATGHRATGLVAQQHLTKKARKALDRLLKGESLAMATTWMDEIKSDSAYDYMSDWHWVTIPEGQTYEQSAKNPNGDVIQTLERIIEELKSKKLTAAEQLERIKILAHLVGDIHQPLHVGARDDRGGNNVKVKWFGRDSNLHRVWDSEVIDDSKLSYTELAFSLPKASKADIKLWQSAPVREWAKESQAHLPQVYEIGDGRLGYRYIYLNNELMEKRLLQAGVRLAGILNEIYG